MSELSTSPFPRAMADDAPPSPDGLLADLTARVELEPFNLVATVIFALAILHTFAAARFDGAVSPLGLLAGAALPTLIAAAVFRLL